MRKGIARFSKHLFSAIIALIRHFSMTASATLSVAITLLLMSLFLLIAENINTITNNITSDIKIHASIDDLKTKTDIQKMKTKINKYEGVEKVSFSSKEDELKLLVTENSDVYKLYKKKNPMNNIFIIEVADTTDIPTLTNKLNKTKGIMKAQYGGDDIENMIQAFRFIRVAGILFLIGLACIAVFLISNTIKMTIFTRIDEISIMRHVGASDWYIKTPFMMEGVCIGILGALVPVLLTRIGYTQLYNYLDQKDFSSIFTILEPTPFTVILCIALLIVGALVGGIGSFHAVNRYLRYSR